MFIQTLKCPMLFYDLAILQKLPYYTEYIHVQVNKEKTRKKKRERDRSAPNVAVGSSRGRNTRVEKLAYIRSRRGILGQDVLPVVAKPPRRDENAAAALSLLIYSFIAVVASSLVDDIRQLYSWL